MVTDYTKVLNRLERRSKLEKSRKVDTPPDKRMLAITRNTGELIDMILFAIKAKNVLEIGTSAGYSTLWCASVVKSNSGRIFTIEKNPDKVARAKKNFEDAKVGKNINVINGMASDVLEQFNAQKKFRGFFDFVLIDADKENVARYFDLAVPLVRRGGIIMTDNILHPEKYRGMMKKFSAHVRKNPKIKTITCPIGNGEEISVKV